MNQRAFTLIELLVSIGVLAILIGILLPALSATRTNAFEIKAMSQLRDLGLTLELYTQQSKNFYPWHSPDEPYNYSPPNQPPTGNLTSSDDPWTLRTLWPTTLHDVAPWSEHYLNWLGANPSQTDSSAPWRSESGSSVYSPYQYSNSFVGDPTCWLANGLARSRPVRHHEVRFPSSKALMFDLSRNYLTRVNRVKFPRAVLASDSSVKMRFDTDSSIPTQNRARPGASLQFYHDTPGGVVGRDF